MNQQNRPWKKISVASEKKKARALKLFLQSSSVQELMLYLKLTKGLNFERAQYCLISNASVFLENLCKPEPVGGALFYGNSSKFLFSNPPGLALFHIACKKFSIWSKNQIFWVRARNFFKNQVAQSIKQTQGYKLSLMIFLIFFPLFYQEMPIYGPKNGFWGSKQQ